MSCLLVAVQKRHTKAACVLLKYGADTEVEDDFGRTSLVIAAKDGNTELVDQLLYSGARINFRDTCRNMSPVEWACEYDRPEVVELLCSKGADLNSYCKVGKTATHYAAMNSPDCLKVLHSYSADIEFRDGNNATPLITAAMCSQVTSMQLLLQWGALIEARDDYGRTALTCNTNPGTVSLLLEWGADISWTPNDGKNIIERATELEHTETLQILNTWQHKDQQKTAHSHDHPSSAS
eukprot:TRINITY_DN5369_c0_g1_i1.p1 TRINITY_DN5369_c0_g1~~TRINITY_DN5369_c0_g1_i1.p1  ORF type:complete len:237 (+),score=46.82 TRINITY_DN5369_c0_g1_i1:136-846(+)